MDARPVLFWERTSNFLSLELIDVLTLPTAFAGDTRQALLW